MYIICIQICDILPFKDPFLFAGGEGRARSWCSGEQFKPRFLRRALGFCSRVVQNSVLFCGFTGLGFWSRVVQNSVRFLWVYGFRVLFQGCSRLGSFLWVYGFRLSFRVLFKGCSMLGSFLFTVLGRSRIVQTSVLSQGLRVD